MNANTEHMMYTLLNAAIFLGMISLIVFGGIKFERALTVANRSSVKSDAVVTVDEELADVSKDYIKGTTVMAEILSYGNDITIEVNGITISSLTAPTGDTYVDYAKKYGTKLLKNYIDTSGSMNYVKNVSVDNEGNMIGVNYIFAY